MGIVYYVSQVFPFEQPLPPLEYTRYILQPYILQKIQHWWYDSIALLVK